MYIRLTKSYFHICLGLLSSICSLAKASGLRLLKTNYPPLDIAEYSHQPGFVN
mgnify:CR=1 FL=1